MKASKQTFAFDVYGTLINPHAVMQSLQTLIGDDSARFSQIWRDKQLEYSFRRGLMNAYEPFNTVTAQALDYACLATGHVLSEQQRTSLTRQYCVLDAFDDAADSLKALQDTGAVCHAFSNGHPDDLSSLLAHSGLDKYLGAVVSVHEVQTFKPAPNVYEHFCERAQSSPDDTWLVSGNPFDIIGAAHQGWKTAWVQRSSAQIFDPWGVEPTKTISSLSELLELV